MSRERITGFTVCWQTDNRGCLALTFEGEKTHSIPFNSTAEVNALTTQLKNQPHSYFDTSANTLVFTTQPFSLRDCYI